MSKGENIFKRKDGRWEARYIKGREASGKIKYGFCYGKTYREAKEKVTKAKAAVANFTVYSASTHHRLSFYCDEWLKLRRIKIKESTYARYHAILEKHIKPKLGGYSPLRISNHDVNTFTKSLLSEGQSSKSVHDILVVLRSVLKYTSMFFPGMLPQIEINYPQKNKKEMRVLSPEEQSMFVEYLTEEMDTCKFGLMLALLTGMRIGELCALQWKKISLKEKTLYVNATVQRICNLDGECKSKTRIIITPPKSDSAIRTIPLTPFALALCEKMIPKNQEAYILTGTSELMEPRTLQYRIAKYTRDCGLEGVHCHTLRHTFATRAIEVGFEIKSLAEILGHASTTITLDRYVHSSMVLKRNNMDKLTSVGL